VLLYEHPSLHAPANGRTNRYYRHGLPLPRRGWAGRFLGAAG
jgi:hypothetical protein